MLHKKFSGHKPMFPHCDDTAVVDGIAQLCQRHVEFVHPGKFFPVLT